MLLASVEAEVRLSGPSSSVLPSLSTTCRCRGWQRPACMQSAEGQTPNALGVQADDACLLDSARPHGNARRTPVGEKRGSNASDMHPVSASLHHLPRDLATFKWHYSPKASPAPLREKLHRYARE